MVTSVIELRKAGEGGGGKIRRPRRTGRSTASVNCCNNAPAESKDSGRGFLLDFEASGGKERKGKMDSMIETPFLNS